MAGLPNFRKLWGKIDGLEKGKYTIEINNQYNVNPFEGDKMFVLATTNSLGGKNYLLAKIHMFLGTVCLLFTLLVGYDMVQE